MTSVDDIRADRYVEEAYLPARMRSPGGLSVDQAEIGGEIGLGATALANVRRFKGTFAAVFAAVTAAAAPCVWYLHVPKYEATSVLEISPTSEHVLYYTDNRNNERFFSQYLATTVGKITSDDILNRVLHRGDVRATDWYKAPPTELIGTAPTELERAKETLSVSIRPRTFLIDVTASTRSSDDAVTLANAVLEEYMRHAKTQSDESEQAVIETLTPESETLRRSIAEAEDLRIKALRELRATSPEQLIEMRQPELEDMNAELRELKRERDLLTWRLGRGHTPKGDAEEWSEDTASDARVNYAEDQYWRVLKAALDEARRTLARQEQQYGPANPAIKAARAETAMREDELDARERALDERGAPGFAAAAAETAQVEYEATPEQLERRLDLNERRIEQLQRDIAALSTQLDSDIEQAQRASREGDELTRRKSKEARISQRLDELRLERAFGTVRVAGRASRPSKPANWKRPYQYSVLAACAGMAAGFASAQWRGRRTPAPREFSRLARAPILGLLPPDQRRGEQHALLDANNQESVRIVRTAILHRLGELSGQAVLLTSAGPSAGKSTLAVLLAKSLAASGRRVLLVDVDLRRPRVAELTGIKSEHDLIDVLSGRASDQDAIVSTETPRLSILPVHRPDSLGDLELLSNGLFGRGLARWRRAYDIVLLDSCPVLPVADARILIEHADGVVLVAREGRCRQVDLTETIACLDDCGGKLLGMVFVESREQHSYRAAYKDYYEGAWA